MKFSKNSFSIFAFVMLNVDDLLSEFRECSSEVGNKYGDLQNLLPKLKLKICENSLKFSKSNK